ncbi:MAG: hypothetical protein ACFFFK_10290 [Candidatus Thorarchaeota archaeon]
MQDLVAIAALLREVSFGILIAGLFYTFGMFALSRIFSAIGEHESAEADHDVDHDVGHDIDHDMDHEIGHEVEHDFDHDVDHEVPYDKSGIFEHDHDLDVDHEIPDDKSGILEHDHDMDVHHEVPDDKSGIVEHDHDIDVDHDVPEDKSGFFETERGAPLGVTIGTSLVTFGFLGSLLYYDGIALPLFGKIIIHLAGVALLVYSVRTVLGKAFVESGFRLEPRHLVGREVIAVSTIYDGFGEIRLETEMGLRRFHARPFQKGVVFQKGTELYIVSADDKFVYVDPRKDVVKWLQQQSKKAEDEKPIKK